MEEKCFIHIHLPRTAGTTIRNLLVPKFLEQCFPDQVYLIDIGPEYGCLHGSFEQFKTLPLSTREKIRFVAGHVDMSILEYVPNPYAFTIMRDPVERALSDYWYCYHASENPAYLNARTLSPIAFIEGGWSQTRNGQARYLSGVVFDPDAVVSDDEMIERSKKALLRIDYVGLYEHLAEACNELCAIANLSPLGTIDLHLNSATRKLAVTAPELAAIRACNPVDQILYDIARHRWYEKAPPSSL